MNIDSTSQPLSESLSSIVYCCNCRGQRELSSHHANLDLGLYLGGHRLGLDEHLHRLHNNSQRHQGSRHIVPGHKRPAGFRFLRATTMLQEFRKQSNSTNFHLSQGNPGGSPLSIIGRPSTVRGVNISFWISFFTFTFLVRGVNISF